MYSWLILALICGGVKISSVHLKSWRFSNFHDCSIQLVTEINAHTKRTFFAICHAEPMVNLYDELEYLLLFQELVYWNMPLGKSIKPNTTLDRKLFKVFNQIAAIISDVCLLIDLLASKFRPHIIHCRAILAVDRLALALVLCLPSFG